ncbi:hypothetical protein GKR56_16975 [Providencia alcalifaciens]|uniref:hypothetical protein n=1 Tax=Providencia alcalifaciens TaxID=126385 RepID=UPI0012B591BF|nr:hypothetical protein [Providencia alcalifaciens]MTC54916.1 hypothetical protein [Providencia alcalifaciens]
MVIKVKVLSRYCSSPPTQILSGSDRLIQCGPLYPDILDILDSCVIAVVTDKCFGDMQLHNITADEIKVFIRSAVSSGRYINSVWCSVNPKGKGIAACDSYEVDGYTKDKNGNQIPSKIYLKFCISKTGQTIMQVSMHPSTFNN